MGVIPADILLLICEELGKAGNFGTLFACALANRTLAASAVLCLYRYHSPASFIEVSADGATSFQWAMMWKSIIRSSLGSTVYPYCLYIRSLDLSNFDDLLEVVSLRDSARKNFFADDMSRFLQGQETPIKKRTRKGKLALRALQRDVVLDLVGESITSFVSKTAEDNHATVLLEDISGLINRTSLPIWTSRLSRLRSMTLFEGNALSGILAKAINEHCPDFDNIAFFNGGNDKSYAEFFEGLKPNSIKNFRAFHAQQIGSDALLSLNNHFASLTTLKLDGLNAEGIRHLSALKQCIALDSLELTANEHVDLERMESDVFEEIVAWLSNCARLKELLLDKFISAPAILSRICFSGKFHLCELTVKNYALQTAGSFHTALAFQKSLESLTLHADSEDVARSAIDLVLLPLTELTNLKVLNILFTSDDFTNSDIKLIASSLPKLEELSISGWEIGDDIWPAIGQLHHLKYLSIHALSTFSPNALLNHIWQLQPTNQGLFLDVASQAGQHDIDEQKIGVIREAIREKVGGRFEFQLHRETEWESNSDSD
ncbi:hypothetical protein BJ878DRAFT_485203 [Calycina marina]|uniref:RNI-like protein n=1 Tax=Calycina marina TaxID=1763456 RepID=A0A9P7ZBS6_9HELO|nr:hypothetical protein BJ878DRAFT_485203 [Calycina marina]